MPDTLLEYLSEGIAEMTINNLSRLQQLRVVPRTTAFRYKGTLLDPAQIGRELGVRIILTGHVEQRNDRLIIGVELIDTVQHSQLWGRTLDRKKGFGKGSTTVGRQSKPTRSTQTHTPL
jgi:adenylate cyclase